MHSPYSLKSQENDIQKPRGPLGEKIPGNNMQRGWEDVGELKWKWSIPYWQDKSQTKGYLPIRITALIQKPVVGCGHEFGGLQYKTMKGVMLTITITRYLRAEDAPQRSLLTALWLFLCCREEVAEDQGSKSILLIKIQPGSEENQTFIDEPSESIISGDSSSKETRNPKLMCANGKNLVWRGERDEVQLGRQGQFPNR